MPVTQGAGHNGTYGENQQRLHRRWNGSCCAISIKCYASLEELVLVCTVRLRLKRQEPNISLCFLLAQVMMHVARRCCQWSLQVENRGEGQRIEDFCPSLPTGQRDSPSVCWVVGRRFMPDLLPISRLKNPYKTA
jgi:hypothetical protein